MTELPTGWRRLPLAELGNWFGGGTPSKGRTDFWENGTVPWLSPKDMGPEVIQSTQDHITDAAVVGSSVRRVPGGSVALVVRSGILERTLPIAVVPFEVTLNQDMKALVPRLDLDARWVAWGLRSLEQELLRGCRKSGTTVASIETKSLMAQELPVPPLDQQVRIIELLEDHLSRLDAADTLIHDVRRRALMLRASGRLQAFEHLLRHGVATERALLEVAVIANGQTPKGLNDVAVEPDAESVPFFKVGDMNASGGRYMSTARTYLSRLGIQNS